MVKCQFFRPYVKITVKKEEFMAGILNIQIKPTIGDKEINLKKVEHFMKKHSDKKLDLVVFPEFFSTGVNGKAFDEVPEDENGGETLARVKELAKKYNTNIVAGSVIERVGDKSYNTCFVIDRNGEVVGKYRKIHLYNYMGGTEGEHVEAGSEIVVLDLDFARVGIALCFDLRYPVQFKEMAKQGAEIFVVPVAWIVPVEIYEDNHSKAFAQDMYVALNRVRAFDNHAYLVSSNQTKDINGKVCAIGNSMIVAPTSQVLANAKDDQTAVYADVDVQLVKFYRQMFPIASID